jgi:hypothetical protein
MTLLPFRANQRTYERQRQARAKERERLIKRIGIRAEDAPLFSEELRFLAYQESKGK